MNKKGYNTTYKRSNSLIVQFKTHILMKFIYLHIFCFW